MIKLVDEVKIHPQRKKNRIKTIYGATFLNYPTSSTALNNSDFVEPGVAESIQTENLAPTLLKLKTLMHLKKKTL